MPNKPTTPAVEVAKLAALREREQRRVEQLLKNAEARRKAQVMEPPLASLAKTN